MLLYCLLLEFLEHPLNLYHLGLYHHHLLHHLPRDIQIENTLLNRHHRLCLYKYNQTAGLVLHCLRFHLHRLQQNQALLLVQKQNHHGHLLLLYHLLYVANFHHRHHRHRHRPKLQRKLGLFQQGCLGYLLLLCIGV
jgi:hypothetical protein